MKKLSRKNKGTTMTNVLTVAAASVVATFVTAVTANSYSISGIAVIGASVGVGSAIIGVYVWVSRHISDSSRHPQTKDIVYKDVCNERDRQNTAYHRHLEQLITSNLKRSDEKHAELKEYMNKILDKLS